MKQDKRTALKQALTSAVLSRWTTPSILAVTLPTHAQSSLCDPQDVIIYAGFEALNVQCMVGSPNRVTFDLVNFDAPNVEFVRLDTAADGLVHISPPLPFDIANGETISVVVDSVVNCLDLQSLVYIVEGNNGCEGFASVSL